MLDKLTKNIVAVAIVVGVVLAGGWLYGYINSEYNRGIQLETTMSAMYESNQNELSTYINSFYEQLGVANLKSAKMDTILTHAIQGRYGENGFSANGAFFAAVTEAYPDVNSIGISYDRLQNYVQAGREGFKGKQDRLLDLHRSYDQFRQTGIIRSIFVSKYFPTNNLQARIGGKVVARGQQALDQMRVIVLADQATQSFATGKGEALIR